MENKLVGIILAAGKGTRFSKDDCKLTQPVNKIPLINYSIEILRNLSITDAFVVVGANESQIRSEVSRLAKDMNITFVKQPKQIGLVNAFLCAVNKMGHNEDAVLLLADEVFVDLHYETIIDELANPNTPFFCGYCFEEDCNLIKGNYSLEVVNDCLIGCTEKPNSISNNMKGTGFCFFRQSVLKKIVAEYDFSRNYPNNICDLMRYCLSIGFSGRAIMIASKEFNINTKETLLAVNSFFKRNRK